MTKILTLIAPALLLVACGETQPTAPAPEVPATETPADQGDRPCGDPREFSAENNCKPE